MRAQKVEPCHAFGRHGAVSKGPLDAEHDIVTCWHLDPGSRRPSQPARMEEIAIHRIGIDFRVTPEIMLHEKGGFFAAHQANAPTALAAPSFLHLGRKDVVSSLGSGPVQRLSRRQANAPVRSPGARYPRENPCPRLR